MTKRAPRPTERAWRTVPPFSWTRWQAGRLYSPALDRMGQLDRIVINASAARKFGFASPQDAVGKILSGINEEDKQVQVVGVAPDIRHRSAVALGSTLRPALAAVRIRPARALRD